MEPLRHVAADGAVIAYRRRRAIHGSSRPPLVLIHGAASNMTRWAEFSETTDLGKAHDVLRLDLRGHAGSLYRGAVSLEIWCDDIASLLRRESVGRAILVGHCLGANIAASFSLRYPQYTAGLVLVEPMPSGALKPKFKSMRPILPLLRAATALLLFFNHLGFYRRRLRPMDLRALDAQLRPYLGTPEEEKFLRQRYGSPWQDIKTTPSAVFLQDILQVLRPLAWTQVRVPMLVLVSSGQAFVEMARTRTLLAHAPYAEVQTIHAEHWIPAERPREMQQAIERWVTARDWAAT